MISTHGWIKLCMEVCAMDMTSLDKVMTLCHKLEARLYLQWGFPGGLVATVGFPGGDQPTKG
eukprot:6864697-Prorocentrum_lima.AAC.1